MFFELAAGPLFQRLLWWEILKSQGQYTERYLETLKFDNRRWLSTKGEEETCRGRIGRSTFNGLRQKWIESSNLQLK
jgi:hypothetical protein